jgi:TPP-dependent pyruvate/acetoin dehydrogenase alpha subunit
LNIAAIWRLPLLFVCNNNQLSVSTPRHAALAPKNLSDVGIAFGMPAQTIDGMDVEIVNQAVRDAVDHVRAGNGPAFLECVSYRFLSHSTTARETRGRSELSAIREKCPIVHYTAVLKAAGILNADTEKSVSSDVAEAVARALAFADASDFPNASEVLTDVW